MMLIDQQNENQGKKDRELSVKEAIGGSIRTGVEEWWCEETQRGKKMEFIHSCFWRDKLLIFFFFFFLVHKRILNTT